MLSLDNILGFCSYGYNYTVKKLSLLRSVINDQYLSASVMIEPLPKAAAIGKTLLIRKYLE